MVFYLSDNGAGIKLYVDRIMKVTEVTLANGFCHFGGLNLCNSIRALLSNISVTEVIFFPILYCSFSSVQA